MWHGKAGALAALAIVLTMAAGAPGQTTRPAGERFRRGEGRGATSRPMDEQRPRGDGTYILERAQQLTNDLKLSDEQKEKVSAIFDKTKEELKSMRQELMGMEPPARFEKIKGVLESAQEKVSGVLTDQQKAEFQKKMQELRAGARAQGAGMMDRLRENLQKLDLSDEQKGKIKDLFDDVRAKAQQAREEADGQMDQMREKMQPIVQDAREKLKSILSKEQQQKLHEMMEKDGGPTTRPATQGGTPNPKGRGPASEGRKAPAKPGPSSRAANNPTTAPAIGSAVADLSIRKLDGSAIQLSSYKGRVVVLEFGSYSSPSFRRRAAAMEQLRNSMGGVATFLLVYTKEAHPVGGWELDRNKDEKIAVTSHESVSDRRAAALKAKESLKITLPILLDEMDDSISAALGATENSLIIIGRDGTLVARQEWADPTGARRVIESVARSNPSTTPIR